MLIILGFGIVVVLLAAGMLSLTMREEPTGCAIVFGGICLLVR